MISPKEAYELSKLGKDRRQKEKEQPERTLSEWSEYYLNTFSEDVRRVATWGNTSIMYNCRINKYVYEGDMPHIKNNNPFNYRSAQYLAFIHLIDQVVLMGYKVEEASEYLDEDTQESMIVSFTISWGTD